MKNFKKFIKESYLGNPLNENKLPDGFHSREDLDQFYNDVAMDEYGKPFAELSIAQKQELISYMNRETEKQFQTDYEKRRRETSDYVNEGFKVGDEIVYRGDKPGKVVHVYDKKSFMNPEVEYKIRYQSDGGTTTARVRGKDIALEKDLDDMGRKYFGKDYDLEEDINDPALVRARAAQMKKDERDREEAEYKAKQAALDKKYGSSFMDKLDAEIGLKQELQDLKDEREQLMIDMEQEAEPEGGEIADLYGMKLNRIDLRTAEIKSELEDLRMYESINEAEIPSFLTKNKAFEKAVNDSAHYNDFEKRVYHILGPKYFKLTLTQHPGVFKDYYDSIRDNKPKNPVDLGEDAELNLNVSNDNDIADEQEANSGVVGESKGFNFKQMVKESLTPKNLK